MQQRLGIRERVRRLDPRLADGGLGLLIALLSIPTMFGAAFGTARRDPDAIAALLALLMTLPLAYRRLKPDLTLLTIGVSTVAYYVLGYPDSFGALGVLIALYSVAAHASRKTAVRGLVYTVIGITISIFSLETSEFRLQILISNFIIFITAWVIGDNVRTRRAYTAELEARARRLESERESRARDAVVDERRRIAREMHDVVAHNVSVMVVQAGAARRVLETHPEKAHEAMTSIESTGRQALTEMRRLTGVLRRDDEPATRPQPGLDRLGKLIQKTREAGLPVQVEIDGSPIALPQGVDLSAYRIIQEALTNTLKHAGPSSASVWIGFGPQRLELRITDNGRGAASQMANGQPAGHGLVGMRERVSLFGGDLKAGPLPGGGYEVKATLPLETVGEWSRS